MAAHRLLLTAGVCLIAAVGCSSTPSTDPTPPPASSASTPASTAPNTEPSTAPSSAAPSASCPQGSYRITGLTGRGAASQLGTGTGGSLTMSFTDGRFTFGSAGGDPMKLDVGPGSADLRIDGQITGTYTATGSALTMSTDEATGKATISGLGVNRSFSMQTVADQLLPAGVSGTATCTADGATLDLPTVALQLQQS